MSNRKVAFSMLLLLLVQVVVPIIPADATSGRSSRFQCLSDDIFIRRLNR